MDDYLWEKGIINKRKGPDIFVKLITVFNVAGWSLIPIALFILEMAKSTAYKPASVQLPLVWDKTYLRYFLYITIIDLFFSLAGLIINKMRHHRKKDQYRISLIVLGIISILGMFFYRIYS